MATPSPPESRFPETPYVPGDPIPTGKRGVPAIIWAARKEDLAAIDQWVALGYPIDAPDGQANTALHWAVYNGCDQAVAHLLALHADPNRGNYNGHTALHHAVWVARRPIIDQLLTAGARWDCLDHSGHPPLGRLGVTLPTGVLKSTPAQVEALIEWLVETVPRDLWWRQNQRQETVLVALESAQRTLLPPGTAQKLFARLSADGLMEALASSSPSPAAPRRPRL